MGVAWEWDICKTRTSSIPQKIFGELIWMVLKGAIKSFARLGDLGFSLVVWGSTLGDGGYNCYTSFSSSILTSDPWVIW